VLLEILIFLVGRKRMARNLSKSKYLSGLQCEKRLWLEINDPDKAEPVSESQQRLFDQRKEVGELARKVQGPGL
jgi:hypothetical protein